jgi:hypothetical protein
MRRVPLALLLGLLAPFAAFMGGAAVEIPGQNPPQEVIAASAAAALFLGVCQYLVACGGGRPGRRWPAAVTMLVPLFVGVGIAEGASPLSPVLIAGCAASLAGVFLARWLPLPSVSHSLWRRSLLACICALVAIALVVAAGVVPPSRADTFSKALPAQAARFELTLAALNLVIAGALAWTALRSSAARRVSKFLLALAALLSFPIAFFFTAAGAGFLAHGPAIRVASLLLLACGAVETVVAVVVLLVSQLAVKEAED